MYLINKGLRTPAEFKEKYPLIGSLNAERLTSAMRQFVFAHEYAHIHLGHFEESVLKSIVTPVGDVEFLNTNQNHEFEADIDAQKTLMSLPHNDSEQFNEVLPLSSGGLCFFVVCQILENIRKYFRKIHQ